MGGWPFVIFFLRRETKMFLTGGCFFQFHKKTRNGKRTSSDLQQIFIFLKSEFCLFRVAKSGGGVSSPLSFLFLLFLLLFRASIGNGPQFIFCTANTRERAATVEVVKGEGEEWNKRRKRKREKAGIFSLSSSLGG